MKLLGKYLKPFALPVLLSILLLFGQAMCDLTLPNLMSDIVNTGIQQGGIDEALPAVMNASGEELLAAFMDETDEAAFRAAYTPVEKGGAREAALEKDYTAIGDVQAVELTGDAQAQEAAAAAYDKAAYAFMTFLKGMGEQAGGALDAESGIQDVDMNQLYALVPMLAQVPQAQLDDAMQEAENAQSMIGSQIGASFTGLFYRELGLDMEAKQQSYIVMKGLEMLGIALLGVLAAVLVGFFASRVSASVGRQMRRDVFQKVESFSNAEFDRFSTASLITRTTNDVTQVQMLVSMGLRMLCYAPIMGVGGIIFALQKSTSLSWIIALAVIVLICVSLVILRVAMPKFKLLQKLTDRLNLVSRENLSGLLVVRAFSNEKFEEKRFDTANQDLAWTNRFTQRVMSFAMPFMMLLMNLVSLLIMWVGGHAIADSTMQVGDMMAYIQYAMQIIMSFLFITMIFIMVPRAMVSAQRIREVLDTELSIHDPAHPQKANDAAAGDLVFDDVSFRYGNAEKDTLSHISFTAKRGETTAFIGATGAGKSTLINLIPRFYDVTEGQVLVDGVDVREVKLSDLRDRIGLVPQKGVLFSGTIETNIAYAGNVPDSETVRWAAKIAQADGFINEKPDGYDSEIAQGGTNVSGGQRQRLAIARAVAKRPEIYIFDDSFSALDYATDRALREALQEVAAESTVLIVAQRISTVLNADRIIVLDGGRVAGMGTHKELMENCEEYRQIALSQLSAEEAGR